MIPGCSSAASRTPRRRYWDRRRTRRRGCSCGRSTGRHADTTAPARKALYPPPLPGQAASPRYWPRGPIASVVPPTATTRGELAGYPGPPAVPLSPLAAKNVIPSWPAGVSKCESKLVSFAISLNPQLIETAMTPGVSRAASTARIRFVRVSERASMTRIDAAGAIACAHSTSRTSSDAQVLLVWSPAMSSTAIDGSGSPLAWSKTWRSVVRFGS